MQRKYIIVDIYKLMHIEVNYKIVRIKNERWPK